MFIHGGTSKGWVSPPTYHRGTAWVQKQGRNALMWLEDQGIKATHLIHDRDTKLTKALDQLMRSSEIKIVKSPVKAPNANAFAEAWVATVRRECLDYFACFSRRHLDYILHIYTRFYNEHRPYQRVGNRVLELGDPLQLTQAESTEPIGRIGCYSELGGLLKHYYRQAA